jgi:HEAT repeats
MEQTRTGRLHGRGEMGQRPRAFAEAADLWPRLAAPERGRGDWKISGLLPRRAWTRTLTGCCLGILTCLAAALPAADLPPHPLEPQTREEAPRAVITFRDGRLSVSLHAATWEEVLPTLERHTGIQIRVDGSLAGTLTQEFEALPLEQGLRRLFRDANVLLFYSRGMELGTAGERLVRVWLFPKERGAPEGMQAHAPPSGLTAAARQEAPKPGEEAVEGVLRPDEVTAEGDVAVEEQDPSERLRELDTFAREGDTAALQQGLLDPDEGVRTQALELLAQREGQGATDVLVGLTRSGEPEMRLQALSLLNEIEQADETTVLSALRAGAADGDADVQRYAIEALAAQGSPDAMAYLRQALRNPDPAVRVLVIGSVDTHGQGLPLLQEALADAEEAVRALAAFRLQQEGSERR